jgi:hypothetical protein
VLQLRDLRWRFVDERGTVGDKKVLEKLEGLPGGRRGKARKNRADCIGDYTVLVQLVKDYFKRFQCRIALPNSA